MFEMKFLAVCVVALVTVRAEDNKIDTAVGVGQNSMTQNDGYGQAFGGQDNGPTGSGTKRDLDKPNIIFIMADDLGYNDIGYHNSEVISPNLDELAASGRILNHNYVPSVCTPSRHALLSGKYPFASTMQHGVLTPVSPHCSPLDLKFLPERLKDLGYETAITGKWHLGYCKDECTPMHRGFDKQFGLLHGMGGYYTHDLQGLYDWRDNMVTDYGANGTYTTDLIRDRAVEDIESSENPLFLFVSFTAVHTPLEVPQKYYDVYPNTQNPRRSYLAMMTAMDEAVGDIVQSLKDSGKWDNTLLVFTSDNGGESGGASDNSPLRGCKASLWEGGSRVVGFVSGPLLENSGQEHDGIFHAVDWTPTLVHIAGGQAGADSSMDGVDQYEMIINGGDSARDEFVYNIDMETDPIFGQAAIRVGDYKLIWGHEGYCDGWGIDVQNYWTIPEQCEAAGLGSCPDPSHRRRRGAYFFSEEEVIAQKIISNSKSFTVDDIDSGMVHLFNLVDDPFEMNDLADDPDHADKLLELKNRVLDLVTEEYVAPPPAAFQVWAGQAMAVLETNPDDPASKAWAPGFCNNLDITMYSE